MHHLLYVTNARIPTERAYGLQIMKMCEAFRQQGIHIELIVPWRAQPPVMKQLRNVWEHYHISTPFPIRHLYVPDFVWLDRLLPERLMMLLFYAQCLMFACAAVLLTCFHRDAVYYTRDLPTLFVLCLTKVFHRKAVYFEAHQLHGGQEKSGLSGRVAHAAMRWMLGKVDGVVVITHRLKSVYAELGADKRRILVAPDGLDTDRLSSAVGKDDARKHLGIPLDKKIVCYTGHLFSWKGVYTLAESCRHLAEEYLVYLIGGMERDIGKMRDFVRRHGLDRVRVVGYVPYAEVPDYLAAADVLALPNSATTEISREWTSPLKMFEYMGARRPIVASDLPSIGEILRHQENAYLIEPDNPEALAAGIQQLMQQPALARSMVAAAHALASNYTWEQRAKTIQAFIELRV